MPLPEFIHITDDTTTDEIREAIQHLSQTAGLLPVRSEAKARVHARINALLTELEKRP